MMTVVTVAVPLVWMGVMANFLEALAPVSGVASTASWMPQGVAFWGHVRRLGMGTAWPLVKMCFSSLCMWLSNLLVWVRARIS